MGKILIIAHRGASAYEPENSLRAIETAIKLKADMVEVDIRKSKDGELVVIHDEFVDRVSDGKGFVKNLTLKRLKKLNLALGEKIPTLKEVLSVVKGRVKLVVEVKSEGLERKLVKLLEKEGMVEYVIISSFNHQTIKKIKALNRKIACGIIFKCKPLNPPQQALDVEAEAVFPYHSYVSKDFVEKLHKEGLNVYAWTVDDVNRGRELIKSEVDGIVTNKPDIFTGVKLNLKRVFIAGPIQGMEEKQAYRVKLKRIFKNLGFEVLDAWEREKFKEFMEDLARKYQVFIIAGSIPEKIGERYYNTSMLISPEGEIGRYRKIHLHAADKVMGLDGYGEELKIFETPYGKASIIICYDSLFPEISRILRLKGVEILFVPSAAPDKSSFLDLRRCCEARVVENQFIVVHSVLIGGIKAEEEFRFYGKSSILYPGGNKVLADGKIGKELIVVADVDMERIRLRIKNQHVVKDLRPEIYSQLCKNNWKIE